MAKAEGRLILLDVDGVIVDSFALLYKNLSAICEEKLQKTLTEDQFREFFKGNPFEEILKFIGLFSVLHVDRKDLERVFSGYESCAVYDGMADVMRSLSQKHTLGIITSSDIKIVQPKFESEGLDAYVTAYLGAETDRHKDKKIRLVMSEFGFTPEQTWFVSDTSGDIIEAQKTAVHTVGVTWGYHPKTWMEAVRPDHIAETPARLLEILLG